MAPKFNIERNTKIRNASHAASSFAYYVKKAREAEAQAKREAGK